MTVTASQRCSHSLSREKIWKKWNKPEKCSRFVFKFHNGAYCECKLSYNVDLFWARDRGRGIGTKALPLSIPWDFKGRLLDALFDETGIFYQCYPWIRSFDRKELNCFANIRIFGKIFLMHFALHKDNIPQRKLAFFSSE